MGLATVVSSVPGGKLPSEIREQRERQQRSADRDSDAEMKTPGGLPPYLHHTNVKKSGILFTAASLVGLLWFISEKQTFLEVEV